MHLRNILVVHEAKSIRNMLKTYILSEFNDTSVIEASSAAEGLQRLGEQEYAVIICSKQALGIEGTTLYAKMRNSSLNNDTPFLVSTSTSSEENIKELAKHGIEHYLISPFTPKELRTKIDSVCNPREWRTHERFSIPGTKAIANAEASVVNVSINGIACDLAYKKEYTDLMEGRPLTIRFSPELNGIQIKNVWCKFLRSNVLVWGVNCYPIYVPELIRVVWQFIDLPDTDRKTLLQVFENFKKTSLSEK
jgi:DNA-binding response OmpR family regulator